MFAAIVAAFGRILAWLLSAGSMKWALGAFLAFGLTLLVDLVLSLLPAWFSPDALSASTSVFPPSLWFFIDYFQLQLGLSMTFAAYCARFLIRRIPFIG